MEMQYVGEQQSTRMTENEARKSVNLITELLNNTIVLIPRCLRHQDH